MIELLSQLKISIIGISKGMFMKVRIILISCLIGILTLSCSQNRVKKYQNLLDPLVGKAKKDQINALIGNPVSCKNENRYEKCEYRTAHAQNTPVPDMFKKSEGPDLSPYEYFDVLYLYFDPFHVLKEWEPVVIAH
jgi:hypothetical protein